MSNSWVENMIVFPVCVSDFNKVANSCRVGRSRNEVGSSNKIWGVSWAMALAIIIF